MTKRLLLALMPLSAAVAAPAGADLTAGMGRAEIGLTADMLPIDGFTAIHDGLMVRVLLFDDGKTRFAITVLDQTAIAADLLAATRETVARLTKTPAANVWVVAAANFAAPHIFMNRPEPGLERYRAAMDAAIASAASRASASLAPARIAWGEGQSTVNVNRNVEMADGWWLGSNDHGVIDRRLGVLRLDRSDGRPIGILANYPVQSSVMDQTGGTGGGKGVTGDLGGNAARRAEALLGGDAVAMFVTGASGDQGPAYTAVRNVYDSQGHMTRVDIGDKGFVLAEMQGERLGAEAVRAARAAAPAAPATLSLASGTVSLPAKRRPPTLAEIKPTRSYEFTVTGKADAPYFIARIGDGVMVGTQVQLDAATGMEIRRRSPFRHTLVLNMVNGGAKYLASAAGYKAITYQAMNSGYAPGGAEALSAAILGELAAMKKSAGAGTK
ncbi:hypothetical protein H7F51_07680 [Novosphingobium flavum]|uniref:Uncharacterized protein n=1 Tax=Novosphingobium flavum TaxID=1778672 RepID=A0A7X1KLB1_9SPHN|nr:hypothetical protein [Novosphingobium flavum]MBC2665397.1 hypothetical protein [Novosphingobium flavum]